MSSRNRSRLIPLLLVGCVACCLSGGIARADIPRPRPNPDPPVKPDGSQLIISTDTTLKEAHLRIPASALKPGAHPGSPRSDAGASPRLSPVQTVMVGLALTTAITFSGLLLVRSRGGRARLLMVVAVIGGAGVVASMAIANAPPPHRPIDPPPTTVSIPAGGLKVSVVIEIVDDGPIQLTIPGAKAAN